VKETPRLGVSALSIAGGLLIWEGASRLFVDNSLFLAAPSQIALAIVKLAWSGDLARHIEISAAEFAIGYVIASLMGIALGLLMAESAPRAFSSLGSPGFTRRRPSRWRRSFSSGSASASGRRCWS